MISQSFLLGNFPASEFYMPTFRNTLFHLHNQVGMKVLFHTYLPMEIEQCSETSAYRIQKPGNYPEGSIQHSEHGEILKSRIYDFLFYISETLKLMMVVSSSRNV